ncbi:helix-turn-helix domain-containing protein [Pinibacter soli]|uniref:Helix-turn-helix domain-containing protein n=1 Tax=Pinibacter soli TaxID=3044211 RepID=A0ABT6R7P3_9BACT|nr:helix-turn-helix domain-containing protein [Pinibacter soli]MDI3318575.1 helix-turn-helix domain-containing protein [Pinibacter soli]
MMFDSTNERFQMAVKFVNHTSKHIFLTGKAGTGKTTFLKYIKENTFKKMAVVAPTGVAAINAGGVTMHSFFQLPFVPFLPTQHTGWNDLNGGTTNAHALLRNIRFNYDRRELLRELELLVIDEVSMVRADMLDAVDVILRHFRKRPMEPFGGVQILYIGDLYQLPPVVRNEEWSILKQHYKSPFFFDAQVMQQTYPLYVELDKIYRQSDLLFINILNNIRNNVATNDDLDTLHQFYRPGYRPAKEENFITLTSHNAQSDSINYSELEKLPGKSQSFDAKISGDFGEKAFPAEKTLNVKVGAQIMFIKNDKGEARKFYNGKIGTIKAFKEDKIVIEFPNDEGELEIEREQWKNVKFVYNKEKDTVDEEELGMFEQFPIRLAWAITIHKSQGLTFNKAIIDAGASFAPGQVYVALSRLTNLEGLILFSRIQPHAISTDERVIAFSQTAAKAEDLKEYLEEAQKVFIAKSLLISFDWEKIVAQLENLCEENADRQIPEKEDAIKLAEQLLQKAWKQKETAQKFLFQLERLVETAEADNYVQLNARMEAAANYFKNALKEELIDPFQKHIDAMRVKKRTGKYVGALKYIQITFLRKKQQIEQSFQITSGLVNGLHSDALLAIVEAQRKNVVAIEPQTVEEKTATAKPKKGDTYKITLEMYKQGKSVAEISKERGFAFGTIESHLTSFLRTGEVKIQDLVPPHKLPRILSVIKDAGDDLSLTPIKQKLGEDYSFGEIRAAITYYTSLAESEDVNQEQ